MYTDPLSDMTFTEITSLKRELERIKDGIKRCDATMIVDGNDMYDWGWQKQTDAKPRNIEDTDS